MTTTKEAATERPWMWAWRDDEDAPASIFSMVREGHAYAVAMCPRYQKPARWVADAVLIVEAVNSYDALRARVAELEGLGRFLVHRLEEFDPGDEEPEREYHGHVAPALARFSAALGRAEQ